MSSANSIVSGGNLPKSSLLTDQLSPATVVKKKSVRFELNTKPSETKEEWTDERLVEYIIQIIQRQSTVCFIYSSNTD